MECKKLYMALILVAFLAVISLNLVSAIAVNQVKQGTLYPGETTSLKIDIKNILDDDVTDVSFRLVLANTGFITIGASEDSENEIKEGKTETFSFSIKASQNISPGDYNLPYELSYVNTKNEIVDRKGFVGISVSAKTELEYSAETDIGIVGEKGKVSLKIVNSGFSDIRFINVKISGSGFTLLGGDNEYIGTLKSDDFETASFDALFQNEKAVLIATVEYKDFENNEKVENIELPLKVYTREKALELGLIKKSNTYIYVIIVIVLIVIYLVYRMIKKIKKLNSSE